MAPSRLDRRVDAVLEEISDLLGAMPRQQRAAVLMEVTAALVDTMLATARDPQQAAEQMRRWVDAGLAEAATPAAPSASIEEAGQGAPRLH